MDEIWFKKFFGPIFNPTHHLICLHVLFLAVREDLVQKRWGRNSGSSLLAKNSSVWYFFMSQLSSCACKVEKKSQKNHLAQPSIYPQPNP